MIKFKQLVMMASAIIALLLTSCSSDEVITAQISIPSGSTDYFSSGLEFPASGGETELVFSTNVNWTMNFTRYQDWCTLSQEKGEAGTNRIKIKAKENTAYDIRVVEVEIHAEDSIRRIVISQMQKDAILLSQKNYNIDKEEQDILVTVNSNIDFSVSIIDADWIKEEIVTTRGLSEHKIRLHIDENQSYDERTCVVRVSTRDESVSEEIRITQAATEIIKLDNVEFNFDEDGGIFTVGVTSNVNYQVQILCDWIQEVSDNATRALSTSHKTFQVNSMEGGDSRYAIIRFYYPSMQNYVDVKIYQNSTFYFDANTLTMMVGDRRNLILTNGTGTEVLWESSNTSVAIVDNTGQVTAVGTGTALIKASTVDGKRFCRCSVEVHSISDYISCQAGVSLEVGNVWKTVLRIYNSSTEQVKLDRIEVQQNGLFVRSFENEGYLWGNSSREFKMDVITGLIKFIVTYSYGGKSYTTTESVKITDTGYGYAVDTTTYYY